jgi:TolB-like protein/class 3 adenylate cyclase/Tfp pilus assembly protein PilF
MADEGFKRKLAAILSADVEGYSRLMDDDEEATVRTLTAYRTAISDLVEQFRGRIVDTPGDNILAEFSSVVDSVNCAVELQRELAERNEELPDNRKMQFRIGVNLGDVIDEDGRIYGDGVNIAARVESLAEAGGICISGRAHDQVENKLGLEYEDLGKHEVKNISRPIQVYRVLSYPGAAAHRVVKAKKTLGRKWRKIALSIAAAVVAAIAVFGIWHSYLRRPTVEPASVEKMAHPLPGKPSIAVLPFNNMSGDPEQEYFSDGLSEEIITALSKITKLFVIARNSSFSYKGKPVKVKQVAEELGVRYVLEGSVRKAEDRVRITAQLIDALDGHHLWAERYDRDLKDIFALQDEITMKVINALQVELTEGEHARLWAKGTDNLEAYLKSLRAREYYLTGTREDNDLARRTAEEAIALDPEYAPPYHFLSITYYMDTLFGTTKSPKQSMTRAAELVKKAIALDDSYALAHGWLGVLLAYSKKYEESVMEAQKCVALDPNGAHGYLYLSIVYRWAGRHAEAVEAIEKAIRLNPFPPNTYFRQACGSYYFVGRYEEAIAAGKRAVTLSPNDPVAHTFLSAAYSLAGQQEEARIEAEEALRLNPKISLAFFGKVSPWKNQADREFVNSALRKAGLPE